MQLQSSDVTVLVVDLVESVRLVQANEEDAVARWLGFVRRATRELIPQHNGRVVKSLGDGLMACFDSPRQAVQAAMGLHTLIDGFNDGQPAERHMALRAGVHTAQAYVQAEDIYGAGVNLVARLAALAGPGETVVSVQVRDRLTDGLDVTVEDLGHHEVGEAPPALAVEDMGDCYLKHVAGPTRVYRVGPAGAQPVLAARRDYSTELRPAIAVVPFASRSMGNDFYAVGELIADGAIVRLSHARHFRVISRLTTTAFRHRSPSPVELQAQLDAAYVLTGSYATDGQQLLLTFELCDARKDEVVKAGRLTGQLADLLQQESELIGEIVASVHDAIFANETARVQTQPLPTLQSYTLMLGGIQLLHRASRDDFSSSFDVFEHLARNHPRALEPQVWQAQWYALRAIQGLTSDRRADARAALACTARALQAEPNNSFALAMEGFVHCHLTLDFDAAAAALEQSVTLNPSETFGHLFSGITMALKHDYEAAIGCYERAVSNSPLDPAMYMFETIGAYLCLSAGHVERAVSLARRSLRLNRTHAHSWRILTIAQAESGRIVEAQASLRELLKLQPDLTVRRYLAGQVLDDLQRHRFSEGLRAAGLPAG